LLHSSSGLTRPRGSGLLRPHFCSGLTQPRGSGQDDGRRGRVLERGSQLTRPAEPCEASSTACPPPIWLGAGPWAGPWAWVARARSGDRLAQGARFLNEVAAHNIPRIKRYPERILPPAKLQTSPPATSKECRPTPNSTPHPPQIRPPQPVVLALTRRRRSAPKKRAEGPFFGGRATPPGEGQDGGLRPRVLARALRSSEANRAPLPQRDPRPSAWRPGRCVPKGAGDATYGLAGPSLRLAAPMRSVPQLAIIPAFEFRPAPIRRSVRLP
jgi:hypothetical protein